MLVPAIFRKDRHRILPKNTRPTNNHHGFPTETCRVVRFFLKNARVRGCGFSKNRDQIVRNFLKSLIELLRIFKKPWSRGQGFCLNLRSGPGNLKKVRTGRRIIFLKILIGSCSDGIKVPDGQVRFARLKFVWKTKKWNYDTRNLFTGSGPW